MLIGNKILERLDISGINLGNSGFNQIIEAFNYGLTEIVEEKKKEKAAVGIFIMTSGHTTRK